jgi:hypothetical protein
MSKRNNAALKKLSGFFWTDKRFVCLPKRRVTFKDIILPSVLWPWGPLSLQQKSVPGIFLRIKGGRRVSWPHRHQWADMGSLTSHNPMCLHRLLQGYFYFYVLPPKLFHFACTRNKLFGVKKERTDHPGTDHVEMKSPQGPQKFFLHVSYSGMMVTTSVGTGNFFLTPWSESASELYRPSDRRLSAKWLPTCADRRRCHVVSVTDPSGRISRFSRQEPLLASVKRDAPELSRWHLSPPSHISILQYDQKKGRNSFVQMIHIYTLICHVWVSSFNHRVDNIVLESM